MKIRILGHPRSGNHYLGALVGTNFLGTRSYLPLVGYRCHKLWMRFDDDTKFLYVYRETESVLKSIFAIRERFGLDVGEYERFLQTRYADMYNPCMHSRVSVNFLERNGTKTGACNEFERVPFKPAQWCRLHKAHFRDMQDSPNLLLVSYGALTTAFDKEMTKIAEFLGSTKKEFENIQQKVGWGV